MNPSTTGGAHAQRPHLAQPTAPHQGAATTNIAKARLRALFQFAFTVGLMVAVLFGILTVLGQIIGVAMSSAATVEFASEKILPVALVGAAAVCIFSLLCTYVDPHVDETDD